MKFKALILMELTKLRLEWMWALGMSSLFPLAMLLFMKASSGPAAALYAVSGSLIFSLVFHTVISVSQELSSLKEVGSLDYYATLPVSRLEILGAMLVRTVLFSLPAMVTIAITGWWLFGLLIFRHPIWLAFILGLGVMSLSGLAVWMGLKLPSAKSANIASQIAYLLIIFCSPVFVARETLPFPFRGLARVFPTTYLAEALRMAIASASLPHQFYGLVAALTLFCPVSLAAAYYAMDWRSDR